MRKILIWTGCQWYISQIQYYFHGIYMLLYWYAYFISFFYTPRNTFLCEYTHIHIHTDTIKVEMNVLIVEYVICQDMKMSKLKVQFSLVDNELMNTLNFMIPSGVWLIFQPKIPPTYFSLVSEIQPVPKDLHIFRDSRNTIWSCITFLIDMKMLSYSFSLSSSPYLPTPGIW